MVVSGYFYGFDTDPGFRIDSWSKGLKPQLNCGFSYQVKSPFLSLDLQWELALCLLCQNGEQILLKTVIWNKFMALGGGTLKTASLGHTTSWLECPLF